MKLPRDISGTGLAKAIERYGYKISRQTGSHLRLTTRLGGEHHITIPAHSSAGRDYKRYSSGSSSASKTGQVGIGPGVMGLGL